MGFDEFYKGKEYKGASEHASFKLEILNNKEIIFSDENKEIKEDNNISRKDQPTETGNYKKNSLKKDSSNEQLNKSNTSANNISSQAPTSNIISTASAATAGVVAIAAISIVMATPPILELLNFNVGGDYLDYTIETYDYVEGISYFVEIKDNDNYHYKKQIETPGIYEEIISDLTPSTHYTYMFIGYDEAQDYKIYYEKEFYTKFNYLATYNKYNLADCKIRWLTNYGETPEEDENYYRIIIPTKFTNNTDNQYEYRITLFNDEGLNEVYQGINSEVIFEIPRDHKTAQLKYESILIEDDKEIICDTLITEPYTFEIGFDIYDIGIDYYYSTAYVMIDIHAPYDYSMFYYTSTDPTPQELGLWEKSNLSFYSEETTYHFYMVNELGEKILDEVTYTLSPIEKMDVPISYSNPQELTITYNENGSVNAYLDTQFECEDPDVYYMIRFFDEKYGVTDYVSRNRYASIEDLVINNNYSLTYSTFKKIDGVSHCFYYVAPSGTLSIEEPTYTVQASIDYSLDTPVFNFSNYSSFRFDLNSMYLIFDNGERFDIPKESFIEEGTHSYSLSVELQTGIESADLHVMGSTLYNIYDVLKEIPELKMKGNCYREVVINL